MQLRNDWMELLWSPNVYHGLFMKPEMAHPLRLTYPLEYTIALPLGYFREHCHNSQRSKKWLRQISQELINVSYYQEDFGVLRILRILKGFPSLHNFLKIIWNEDYMRHRALQIIRSFSLNQRVLPWTVDLSLTWRCVRYKVGRSRGFLQRFFQGHYL